MRRCWLEFDTIAELRGKIVHMFGLREEFVQTCHFMCDDEEGMFL